MEMREKIARALAPLAWAALGTGDTLSQKNRRTASLRHADAVLTAIGETHVLAPRIETDEMCEAGLEALRENLGHSSVIMRDAAACYRAMLAAVREGE